MTDSCKNANKYAASLLAKDGTFVAKVLAASPQLVLLTQDHPTTSPR
jgi:hypothetical protein